MSANKLTAPRQIMKRRADARLRAGVCIPEPVTLFPAVFLGLFLKIFRLGPLLVFGLTAGRSLAARSLDARLADIRGTHTKAGQQLLDVVALTRRTSRSG